MWFALCGRLFLLGHLISSLRPEKVCEHPWSKQCVLQTEKETLEIQKGHRSLLFS